ncbi:MAG: DNA topoisomerase VI subunit B [Nanoarchaeota archaeon]|nr:DNA topoisomerase VI subunit B [Nanoarchaeota archaeon]
MAQTKLTDEKGSVKTGRTIADELATKQRDISVSEFFLKNRHLLGFDNPKKALLTSVKEAVDNSLDACEEMKIAPELKVIIETVKDDRYRITVEDNGPGIIREHVGKVFGKLLYGSKFHRLKCSRGQQGIGICMSPDTLVPTANGNIKEIKDIVDKEKKEDIFVLRPDLKLSRQKISTFFKVKAPPYIVKLNVLGGKEIELSPENPVLVKTEQGLDWKRADCLSKGDYVAVAKTLDVQPSEEPYTLSVIDKHELRAGNPELIKDIMCKLKKKYGSFIKIAARFGIKKDHVMGFTKRPLMRNPELSLLVRFAEDIGYKKEEIYEKATRVGRLGNYINIPVKLCPKLFRFAGLIAGDGNIQKKRKDRRGQNISFWNKEEALIQDFKNITDELFGINARIIRDKREKGSCVQFSSAVAANLLEKLGLPAGRKCESFTIPPLLLQASNMHIAEYIRGLFDAEGSVSGKRGDISFMITNEKVIRHISLLLLRFGIHSTINKAGKHKRLIISGRSNVKAFNEKIGFISPKQANRLKNALKKECKSHPIMLVYPKMGQCILNAEKSLGMSHYALRCGQAKTELLGKKYMAYDTLSKIFSTLKSKAQKKVPAELQEIYALLNSDIGWSNVANVEFAEPKYDYVYDVTMARGNNFVANGIVVHNSASAMYGQLTTGKPIKIWSRISPKKPAMYFELFIDTRKNEPNITKQEEIEWPEKEHGIKIEIELEAKYTKGKQSVDDYLKQVAIANPHTHIIYITPEKEVMEFPSVTKQMPKEPKEIKPHPYGVELGMLMKMLKESKANTLSGFLQTDFCRVSPNVAKEICDKAGVDIKIKPGKVMPQEVESIYKAIQNTKIMSPPTDCLVPIGEEALEKGLKKEVAAEFYTAVTRPPSVYRGNPFVIETALAYGGSLESDDLVKIMRFANRVPLLYQQSSCSSYSAVVDTAWRNYGLGQSRGALPSGPVLVLVHMSSVWVPFTSEAKEAIASYPEIIHEMKLALQECGRRMGLYIRKNIRAREQKARVNLFESYIPELADSLSRLTGGKKENIAASLQKMLKKGMKNIISDAMSGIETDKKGDEK